MDEILEEFAAERNLYFIAKKQGNDLDEPLYRLMASAGQRGWSSGRYVQGDFLSARDKEGRETVDWKVIGLASKW